jgi:hypothetical protein
MSLRLNLRTPGEANDDLEPRGVPRDEALRVADFELHTAVSIILRVVTRIGQQTHDTDRQGENTTMAVKTRRDDRKEKGADDTTRTARTSVRPTGLGRNG